MRCDIKNRPIIGREKDQNLLKRAEHVKKLGIVRNEGQPKREEALKFQTWD